MVLAFSLLNFIFKYILKNINLNNYILVLNNTLYLFLKNSDININPKIEPKAIPQNNNIGLLVINSAMKKIDEKIISDKLKIVVCLKFK